MLNQIIPKFVDEIPREPNEGYLYICIQYGAVIHKCACGCGDEISTPLGRHNGWIISYDGEKVSLSPSIGNGSYNCHSHYLISENKIIWLGQIGKQNSINIRKETFWSKIKKNISKKKVKR